MKKNILFIVLVLTLVGFKAQGQIRDEIRSFVDSTEIFMNNGRRLLLHSIMEDDILKSRQIYFYLRDESQKKNCSALSYQEELLVLAIISDWSGFFNHVSSYNDFTAKRMCYHSRIRFRVDCWERLHLILKRLDWMLITHCYHWSN